jgi:hypothetical protein
MEHNEKSGNSKTQIVLLSVVAAVLGVFVIGAWYYIIFGVPEFDFVTDVYSESTETAAKTIHTSALTTAPVINESSETTSLNLSELSPAYYINLFEDANADAKLVFQNAATYMVKCQIVGLPLFAAPVKGVIDEKSDVFPELSFDAYKTREEFSVLLNDALEYYMGDIKTGAYVLMFDEQGNPTAAYFAEDFESEIVGAFPEARHSYDKATSLSEIYNTLEAEYYSNPANTGRKIANDGKTLTFFGYNSEILNLLEKYYFVDKPLPSDINFDYILTPGRADYQLALDSKLVSDAYNPKYDRVDFFTAESEYLKRYVDTPYAIDLAELGITDSELQNQFDYARDAGLDRNFNFKAVAPFVYPNVIAYRRSIAREVLGTDDPEKVALFMKDKAAFDKTAAKMSEAGYRMISGYDDLFSSYINGGVPIVEIDSSRITVPDSWSDWVDDTMEYTEKGYSDKTVSWTDEWMEDMSNGKVFCFQGPQWFIDFTLKPNVSDTDAYGDYAVVPAPVSSSWGETWLLASSATDNTDYVADIFRYFTTDPLTMEKWARENGYIPNNSVLALTLAEDKTLSNEFLGGQNPYSVYINAAEGIDEVKYNNSLSKYGELYTDYQIAFKDYFDGEISKKEARENFYKTAIEKYPELYR